MHVSVSASVWRNCEWFIKRVIVYLMVIHYMDNFGNARANTCAPTRLRGRVVFIRCRTNPSSAWSCCDSYDDDGDDDDDLMMIIMMKIVMMMRMMMIMKMKMVMVMMVMMLVVIMIMIL